MKQLAANIEILLAEVEGEWSIVLEDLQTGDAFTIAAEKKHYAASVIKLPIMAAVFARAEKGELRFHDQVTMQREDMVGGAGVLQHLTAGSAYSIYDLVTLMIIQSDNTATNLLIDVVGVKQIQETMRGSGMADSHFYNKLMTVPVELSGYNMITAADIAHFLRQLSSGKIVSYDACERMIAIMKNQQIHYVTEKFPNQADSAIIGAQPIWEIASKTGSVRRVRHDVGMLYLGKRALAFTILASECPEDVALQTIATIGEQMYTYLERSQAEGI